MASGSSGSGITRRGVLAGLTGSTLVALSGQTARAHGAATRFDVERFVEDCRRAAAGSSAGAEVHALLERSVASPAAVLQALGEPLSGGITTLYRSPQLTVLNIVWSPLMQLLPHEHRMWSAIGLYSGREDNIFWQRRAHALEARGARALVSGQAALLGADVIHSVANPIARLTGALHVYGGDFFAVPRSEWDPETLRERPWDIEQARRIFHDSNERFAAWQAQRRCT